MTVASAKRALQAAEPRSADALFTLDSATGLSGLAVPAPDASALAVAAVMALAGIAARRR
jgi:hypothetical protein